MRDKFVRDLTPEQRRMSHFDEVKHSIRKFESILEVIALTIAYYIVWKIQLKKE